MVRTIFIVAVVELLAFVAELPDSGPGPLRNPTARRPGPPAYASPLLTPQAAAVVKERVEG